MEDKYMMAISDRIRQRRIELGLTQKQLANRVGVSRSAICNYENDCRNVNPDILGRFFRALQVDANYLFQDLIDQKRYLREKEENDLISDYQQLDYQGRRVVDNSLQSELLRVKEGNQSGSRKMIMTRYYVNFADLAKDDTTEVIELPILDTPINRRASFILPMPDRSMEPFYRKRDKLLIENATNVDLDEIGVFRIGTTYLIRKMGIDSLYGINEQYDPIPFDERVRCLGRVIGCLYTQ